MSFVIRTKVVEGKRTLFYTGCGAPLWQPYFPQIYGSLDMANQECDELKKQYAGIEVHKLSEPEPGEFSKLLASDPDYADELK